MGTSTESANTSAEHDRKSRWRRVLGHYPTGITIISSVDETGSPVGMVVGTFTSVSEDPPLVGFLPQRTSRAFRQIERAGRFRASVLGAGHEGLCREFFTSPAEERFASGGWEYDADGLPRLTDAVAWFDATIDSILPAGDHVMVLGAVEDLGLGSRAGGMPLLFLNGGYGSFTMPRMEFPLGDLGDRLRMATSVGDVVQRLAETIGVGCALSTVIRDEVVVLTAADIRSSYVGTCFPFAAPMDPGFGAWCRPEMHDAWIKNARRFADLDDRLVADVVALVRRQGYAISFGHTMRERFASIISASQYDAAAVADLWAELSIAYRDFCLDPRPEVHARAIQVPVFDADGYIAFELVVGELGTAEASGFQAIVEASIDHARQITTMIGGMVPPHYA